MSTLKTNTITDVAGTGGPTLTNGATFGSAAFAAPSGSAPIYACRAWVNFNGTGTVAIRASGNVSSITDNGTGNYTVNFTSAMPDANYSAVVDVNSTFKAAATYATGGVTVNTGYVSTLSGAAVLQDNSTVSVAVFR